MSEASLNTVQLKGWVDKIQQGDRAAQEELLRAAAGRLERLARKMLKGFPDVRGMEQTGHVLQNAMLRLDREGEQACAVWLWAQLHDRCRARCHRRCRDDASAHL